MLRALTDWMCESRIDDVLLCVSELATNALLHGVPPGRGFLVRLRLDPAAGVLRVEVHDSGHGEVCPADPEALGVAESGRGLLLVTALADEWGVGERNPGKVVWCEFAVRGSGPARGPGVSSVVERTAPFHGPPVRRPVATGVSRRP